MGARCGGLGGAESVVEEVGGELGRLGGGCKKLLSMTPSCASSFDS